MQERPCRWSPGRRRRSRAFFRQDIHGRSGAAQCDGRSDRYIEDGEEHHRSLNEVSQSDGGEAAEEGVEYDDEGADQKGLEVGQTEEWY